MTPDTCEVANEWCTGFGATCGAIGFILGFLGGVVLAISLIERIDRRHRT